MKKENNDYRLKTGWPGAIKNPLCIKYHIILFDSCYKNVRDYLGLQQ